MIRIFQSACDVELVEDVETFYAKMRKVLNRTVMRIFFVACNVELANEVETLDAK